MAITPADPWFYLIFYGGLITFALICGLILTLTQRKKKKGEEQKTEEENQTPN